MPSPTTGDTPARTYGQLLLRLHDLIAKGQGDELGADAVRDEMDGPLHALTEAEQERLGGLSEDLYALAESNPRFARKAAGLFLFARANGQMGSPRLGRCDMIKEMGIDQRPAA